MVEDVNMTDTKHPFEGVRLSAFTTALLKKSLLHLTHERFSGYLQEARMNRVHVLNHVPVLRLHPAKALGKPFPIHQSRIVHAFRQVVQHGQVIFTACLIFLHVSAMVSLRETVSHYLPSEVPPRFP
jgi:hypothetical protein